MFGTGIMHYIPKRGEMGCLIAFLEKNFIRSMFLVSLMLSTVRYLRKLLVIYKCRLGTSENLIKIVCWSGSEFS